MPAWSTARCSTRIRRFGLDVAAVGLDSYAGALATARQVEMAPPAPADIEIVSGYVPGVIGRVAEMHGRSYAEPYGFDRFLEAKVASGIAEFSARLDRPANSLRGALRGGEIVGTVAVDGEDFGAWHRLSALVHHGRCRARTKHLAPSPVGGRRFLRPPEIRPRRPLDVARPRRGAKALRGFWLHAGRGTCWLSVGQRDNRTTFSTLGAIVSPPGFALSGGGVGEPRLSAQSLEDTSRAGSNATGFGSENAA